MYITNPELAVFQGKWAVVTEDNIEQVPDDAVLTVYAGGVNFNASDLTKLCWRLPVSRAMAAALNVPYQEHCVDFEKPSNKPNNKPVSVKKDKALETDVYAVLSVSVDHNKWVETIKANPMDTQAKKAFMDANMKFLREIGNLFGVKARSKEELWNKIQFMVKTGSNVQPKATTPTDLFATMKKMLRQLSKEQITQLLTDVESEYAA